MGYYSNRGKFGRAVREGFIERGDEILFKANDWERKQPLRVYEVNHSKQSITVISNRRTKYTISAALRGPMQLFKEGEPHGTVEWVRVLE